MSKTEPTVVCNAFGRLLSEFRNGASQVELSEAMQECIKIVKETGKAAKLRFELTFTPSNNAVVVTDKIERKLPQPDREGAIFFPTEENTLSRSDPAQRELELRTVPIPEQQVRSVAAAS